MCSEALMPESRECNFFKKFYRRSFPREISVYIIAKYVNVSELRGKVYRITILRPWRYRYFSFDAASCRANGSYLNEQSADQKIRDRDTSCRFLLFFCFLSVFCVPPPGLSSKSEKRPRGMRQRIETPSRLPTCYYGAWTS